MSVRKGQCDVYSWRVSVESECCVTRGQAKFGYDGDRRDSASGHVASAHDAKRCSPNARAHAPLLDRRRQTTARRRINQRHHVTQRIHRQAPRPQRDARGRLQTAERAADGFQSDSYPFSWSPTTRRRPNSRRRTAFGSFVNGVVRGAGQNQKAHHRLKERGREVGIQHFNLIASRQTRSLRIGSYNGSRGHWARIKRRSSTPISTRGILWRARS